MSLVSGVPLLALFVITACGDDSSPTDAGNDSQSVDAGLDAPLPPPLPEGSGEFRVGYRTIPLEYTRPDGVVRSTELHIWYPTDQQRGRGVTYAGLVIDRHTFANPPLVEPPEGGFPVHVHSHGARGFGAASYNLMRFLASHGWISIAPDHVGHLLLDPQPVATELHYVRPWDISATLDALETLKADDPLSGAAATDRVALSSHSFGAITAWALTGAPFYLPAITPNCEGGTVPSGMCSEEDLANFRREFVDPRIVASVILAGRYTAPWFGSQGYQQAVVPVMHITGSEDDVGQTSFFEGATGVDYTWIDIAGGCHFLFTLGGCDNIADEDGWPIIDAYAAAFFEQHVLGNSDGSTILDGTVEVSPLASLERKTR